MMRIAILILGLVGIPHAASCQTSITAAASTRQCQPCTFSPGAGMPEFSMTFELKSEAGERRITAISASNGKTQKSQRLTVSGMEPIGEDQDFFFGGADLDFDGYLDLMLIVRRGAANAYAMYWIFEPASQTFSPLGTYPVFRLDAAKRRLTTYERGGFAGLAYESKEFAWENKKLVLLRDEKQEATAQSGVFRKTIQERVGGHMKAIKTETVRAPK